MVSASFRALFSTMPPICGILTPLDGLVDALPGDPDRGFFAQGFALLFPLRLAGLGSLDGVADGVEILLSARTDEAFRLGALLRVGDLFQIVIAASTASYPASSFVFGGSGFSAGLPMMPPAPISGHCKLRQKLLTLISNINDSYIAKVPFWVGDYSRWKRSALLEQGRRLAASSSRS
jgi:hypothetical protein